MADRSVLTVLTAITGPGEAPLVTGLERSTPDVRVVRRCADLADLLAAAAAGTARAALVSADLPRLDREAVARLHAAGVAVVGVLGRSGPARPAAQRLRALGVTHVLPVDAPSERVAERLTAAVAGLADGGSWPAPPGGEAGSAPPGGESLPPGAEGPPVGTCWSGSPAHPACGLPGQPWPGGSDQGLDPAGPGEYGPGPVGSERTGADQAGSSGWALGPSWPELPADLAEADEDLSRPGAAAGPGHVSGAGPGAGAGRIIAVWGPVGAPGRTTVAIGLGCELARLGQSTLLVDADTYGPSMAQSLALLDESAGLAAAVRAANQGGLDPGRLTGLATEVLPELRVLTGIPRAARWPELRASGLELVWHCAREIAAWTVVDCGFGLEADEELSFDTAAPRRNAATLSCLQAADTVLAVGCADPIGLQRFVRGWQDLAGIRHRGTRMRAVLTRVRASAVGSNPGQRVRDALLRYAGVADPVLVPDDRAAHDAAMLAGRTLLEQAPNSPARLALAGLAEQLCTELAPGTALGATSRSRRKARP